MFSPKPLEEVMLNVATATTSASYLVINFVYKSIVITMTGAGATTVLIEASNDGSNWITVKTAIGDDYYETSISYKYLRARISVAGGKTVKCDLVANK